MGETMNLNELIELCRHPCIQGRRGEWREGDRFTIDGETYTIGDYTIAGDGLMAGDVRVYYYFIWDDMIRATWLPPLSDPIQPERGLWGMINWNRWNMYVFPDRVCMYDHKKGNNNIEIVGPTPEIAVCKAIVAQSEEEK